jgi:phosphatidylserine decarboxylase
MLIVFLLVCQAAASAASKLVFIFCYYFFVFPFTSQGFSPVVQELQDLVNSNATFRNDLSIILNEINSSFPDFFDFWQTYLLHSVLPTTVGHYAYSFGEIYFKIPLAESLTISDPGATWLLHFIKARGDFMDSYASTVVIDVWKASPIINMSQYVDKNYTSFNDFFTRDFKPGMRPICSSATAEVLTSPVDGSFTQMTDTVDGDTKVLVKGETLSITKILGNNPFASQFSNGSMAHLDLAGTDYHHFHAPVDCIVESIEQVPGLAYGQLSLAAFYEASIRTVIILKSPTMGYIAMVPVGICDISSIQLQIEEKQVLSRGEKIGNFAYGGSTIVLLFEQGKTVTWNQPSGSPIKLNQCLGNVTAVQ